MRTSADQSVAARPVSESSALQRISINGERHDIASVRLLASLQKLCRTRNTSSEVASRPFLSIFSCYRPFACRWLHYRPPFQQPFTGMLSEIARPWLCARKFGPTRLYSTLLPYLQRISEYSQVVCTSWCGRVSHLPLTCALSISLDKPLGAFSSSVTVRPTQLFAPVP